MTQLKRIVKEDEIRALWPWASPMLLEAIGEQGNWWELDAIKSWLIQGQLQLWIAEDAPEVPVAFLITELMTEGGDKVLSLRWAGGKEMRNWLKLLKAVECIGMWNKVDKVEVYGRKGWEKALKPYGYEFKAIVLGKRLDYSRTLN